MRMGDAMRLSFKKSIVLIILAAILIQVGSQFIYIRKIAENSAQRLLAYTNTTVKQIENNLDSAFKSIAYTTTYFSINSAVQRFLTEEEQLEKYKLLTFVNDTCQAAMAMNSQIQTALLFDKEGNCEFSYSSSEMKFHEELQKVERECYREAVNNRFIFYQGEDGREILLCITPIYSNKAAIFTESQRIGTVMLVIRPDSIMKVLEETGNAQEVEFYLLDPEGSIMAANSGKEALERDLPGYTYLEREIWGGQGFRIVGKINNHQVVREYDLFRSQMLLSCAVMVGMLLLIGWLFNHTIAHPIDRLIGEVAELGTNRRKKQITGKYHFQLTPLVDKMNEMLKNNAQMSRRIFDTQKRLYEAELLKNKSEIYALRSQINPHFLYNTLQCMGGIALMNEQPVVAEMASNMAEIFRYSIKEGDKVTVAEEKDFLKKYLDICDVRFNGRFRWEMEMEEGVEDLCIDKMILQPLVENAVYHGLEKRTQPGGMLWIKGKREGKSLVFSIVDNGGQLNPERLARLQETLENRELLEQERRARKRIGLVNIQSRLKLMYAGEGGLTMEESAGNVTVTVRFPAKETDTRQ